MNLMQEMETWKMFTSVSFLLLSAMFLYLYRVLVANPMKLRASLQMQGLQGPPPRILVGNVLDIFKIQSQTKAGKDGAQGQMFHDYEAVLFPFIKKWREQYGGLFTFVLGMTQCLYIGDPDMVKELATYTSLNFGKPSFKHRASTLLLGQRKIITPEFYMDKVKGMINLINDSALSVIHTIKDIIDANNGYGEITIDEYMRSFTGDVVSKFCFGSNYSKGEAIFLKIRALQSVLAKNSLYSDWIPGISMIPTKNNREAWALEKAIRDLILQVVLERKKQVKHDHKDLLQILIEEAEFDKRSNQKEKQQFIVDNCKNIYLAAYETTAVSATWCMMLLASDQEWQARVRAEVLQVCDGKLPTSEMLHKMKLLTMVVQETLRLYPPAFIVPREALKDIKIGGYHIPKGVNVWTIIPALHTDPNAWGPDSYDFNPSRFSNGVSGGCKYPQFYMPFGVGPRVCLGQSLAMFELKIMMCLMVQKFSFSLSEKYVHSPAFHMSVEPEHQVPLVIKHL